ncbi:TetR/AcrR family transcriptional regulator C-terminal domain-containing protein [Actinomycetospora lutea]|uniref:TetR/AcrR family transcriptional regulator C-terminal domain-containing protein n=1 Tax=Actinomycetospora lutea TaxID=663604 RepID=UPI0023664344|nr:TetR/AcrR family transcriptional regulator C-terminal domain-containing protein [Actinomycetospora lutea]MDD7939009.1 TetR/AcrR family transcriptional regulator C-terminal domain-containing protein [Actinomycetospora lutea]
MAARKALTRDDVVDAAVHLLAEVGLEGLSLRRLARDLGVSAPTLYWHVTDKRTLLDHVAERLLLDQWRVTPLTPGEDWAEWLRERATVQYRALIAHRDAARVLAGNRPTEAAMPAVEEVLGTLVGAGFTPAQAFASIQAVGNLVIGSALEYQAERERDATTDRTAGDGPAHDPDRFPHHSALAALLADRPDHGADHDALFRHGLDLMIAGLRVQQAGTVTHAG